MAPFEVPLAGALLFAVSVFAFSRLFLTASQQGAVWVATALGLVVIGIGAVIAAKPRVSPNVIAGILSICAVAVVAAGVVATARGERYIEHHEVKRSEEHTSELQSLMRTPYSVFCLKTKKQTTK